LGILQEEESVSGRNMFSGTGLPVLNTVPTSEPQTVAAPRRTGSTPDIQTDLKRNESVTAQIQDVVTLSDSEFYNQETAGRREKFVSLIQGFQETVKEVEAQLADENRIPPSLMRVIRDLTSKSLAPEHHDVDKLV
jgi:hypothetical protein